MQFVCFMTNRVSVTRMLARRSMLQWLSLGSHSYIKAFLVSLHSFLSYFRNYSSFSHLCCLASVLACYFFRSLLAFFHLPYLLISFPHLFVSILLLILIFVSPVPPFLKLSGSFVSFIFISFSVIFMSPSSFYRPIPLSPSSFTFCAFPFIFYDYFLFLQHNIQSCTWSRHAVCAIWRSQFDCKFVF